MPFVHVGGRYARPDPRHQVLTCDLCHRMLAVEIPPGQLHANDLVAAHHRAHLLKYHHGELYRRRGGVKRFAMGADGEGRR